MSEESMPETHKRGLENFKRPVVPPTVSYLYTDSVKDWFKQTFCLSDSAVEASLLSRLPFFPDPDSTRKASIIDTEISNNNYIHEFCIENTKEGSLEGGVRDIVLIHGYAANLGLFFSNFDSLSSIPGVRIHAIDMLGFGFSARPKFPKFASETVDDVMKIEDWFVDSLEEWREKRGITNFILMGHSFGGYISACYAMKYNKANLINKLVLISPAGVERNKFSLLKQIPNKFYHSPLIENEVTQDQVNITTVNPHYQHLTQEEEEVRERTRRRQIINYLWDKHVSPFGIVRNAGIFKSKLISVWTTRRFASYYLEDYDYYKRIHDYFYRSFNAKGSGEYAITRVLGVGALPRLPLADRVPSVFAAQHLKTLWLYGDVDWMNAEAGEEVVKEINTTAKGLANYEIVSRAGHHLYLDNPDEFHDAVFKFIGHK